MNKPGRELGLAVMLASASSLAVFAQSNLVTVAIEVATVQVSWNSETNRQYQFQYSSALTSNTWVNLNAPVRGNGSNNVVIDSVSGQSRKFYRVVRLQPLFEYGIGVRHQFDLNGNNLQTNLNAINLQADSFDSGTIAGSNNGRYDPSKASDYCEIAAYLGITNSVNIGDLSVFGKIFTGPDASISLGPNSSVGDKAWHAAGNFGIEPGFLTNDLELSFPDVTVPFASGGYFTTPTLFVSTNINGTTYAQVYGAGNYRIDVWNLTAPGKNILIQGDVSIWLVNGFSIAGSSHIVLATGAKLVLYVGKPCVITGSAGFQNDGNAAQLIIYGLPLCTSLSFGGNASFTGCIYAPHANFSLNGGAINAYDFVGAMKLNSIVLNGLVTFHYDENLRRTGPPEIP